MSKADSSVDILEAPVEELFADNPEFLTTLYFHPIVQVLKHGGFIAGGFPRALLSGMSLSDYFEKKAGDIDVFFPNETSMKCALDEVMHSFAPETARSMAGFAVDTWLSRKHVNILGCDVRLKMQLIDTRFGSPLDIIRGFDLRNSMVGFDMRRGWVVDGWRELQDANVLDLARQGDQGIMLGGRVAKYVKKYGYDVLSPRLADELYEWFDRHFSYEGLYTSRRQPKNSGDANTPWASLTTFQHILLRSKGFPDELLPHFAGYYTKYIKNSASEGTDITIRAHNGMPDDSTPVDVAAYVLHQRGADPRLVKHAEEVGGVRKLCADLCRNNKALQAANDALKHDVERLRLELSSGDSVTPTVVRPWVRGGGGIGPR